MAVLPAEIAARGVEDARVCEAGVLTSERERMVEARRLGMADSPELDSDAAPGDAAGIHGSFNLVLRMVCSRA